MNTDLSQPTARIWNKDFIIIMFANAFAGISSQMVTPLVSKYAVSIGAPLTIAATIASLMAFSALISRPFSGAVSDTANRKTLLLITYFTTAISVGCYTFARTVPMLTIVRVMDGISFSFRTVATFAYAAMSLPENRLGEGIGYLSLGTIFAQAVSPSFGFWLSENVSFAACFLTASIFSIFAALSLFFVPNKTLNTSNMPKKKFRISFDNIFAKKLVMYTILIGLFSCGNGLVNTYLALLGSARNIANISLFFTAYAVLMIVVRPLSGRIVDRIGLQVILFPAYLIFAVGSILIGSANSLGMIIVAGVLYSLGQGSGTPSIQAHCVKKLGADRAGVASSTCLIGQDLGNTVAPVIGSFVVKKFGYTVMFHGFAVVLAICGCTLYAIQRGIEKRDKIPKLVP